MHQTIPPYWATQKKPITACYSSQYIFILWEMFTEKSVITASLRLTIGEPGYGLWLGL